MSHSDYDRRLAMLENWRRRVEGWQHDIATELRNVDTFCDKYGPLVDAMADADKIANALKANTDAQTANTEAASRIRLAWWQVVIAGVVAVTAVGTFVIQAVVHL